MSDEVAETGDDGDISPDFRGSNQRGIRESNERMVLSLLRRHPGLAKADIARATGLSAQTASVIMRRLEKDGFLARGEPVRGRVGQPSTPMHLASDAALFYGLKIGRRSSELILIDFIGTVRDRIQATYPHPTPGATLDFTRRACAEIQARTPKALRQRIAGLGVAMPGDIWQWARPLGLDEDWADSWRRCDMRAELAKFSDLPVYLENDATAACGAELVFGTEKRPADFLYFYIGYFIGGGVVLGNRLYTGPTGMAGALGSMPVQAADGQTVQLIDVASLAVLEQALKEQALDTTPLWVGVGDWPLDTGAGEAWLTGASRALANAVAAAACVLGVGEVVIEGWLPEELKARLVSQVRDDLRHLNLAGAVVPQVTAGTVGPDARPLGAASLPLSDRYLTDART